MKKWRLNGAILLLISPFGSWKSKNRRRKRKQKRKRRHDEEAVCQLLLQRDKGKRRAPVPALFFHLRSWATSVYELIERGKAATTIVRCDLTYFE
ncbi:hypothetical protein GTNG_0830 [Geobacillus thermodenitrificans NG80-2]|uniref:Uncharacterized protein n=1 Tax=Geobacillus thermodenitrificans (strain NG80-2) TaxID=420246 RepID=A4ILK4_GEOTN|nr:hypothetical protein GTNG_0830 [Geobacillus thermodenitrificans NG80-2]